MTKSVQLRFLRFCSFICTTLSADSINKLPKDDLGFIDFNKIYQDPIYLDKYNHYLHDSYHHPDNVGTFKDIFYPNSN